MKEWYAEDMWLAGSDGDTKLTRTLNRLERNGWTIEGVEFYGKNKNTVMIIAWRENNALD